MLPLGKPNPPFHNDTQDSALAYFEPLYPSPRSVFAYPFLALGFHICASYLLITVQLRLGGRINITITKEIGLVLIQFQFLPAAL